MYAAERRTKVTAELRPARSVLTLFKAGVPDADTSGLMRRMVKEDLLTFDGRPLFPERIAQTVPYQLTEDEPRVTEYVREGMNRAARPLPGAPRH